MSGAPQPPPSSRRVVPLPLAALLYLVSGATGLVYEVGWTRRLLLWLGSTSTASAVVLSTFLLGLGVGGAVGGRRADRSPRPLRLYGVLELVAAGWALVLPWLLAALERPYVALAAHAPVGLRPFLDVAAAAAVVLPGALALGATFPALLRAVVPAGRPVGAAAAWLYGVNTAGAVAGALWTGFSGLFTFGVLGATRAAAAVAAVVGAVAALAAPRGAPRDGPATAPTGAPPRTPRGPLLVAALSGFVALGLEAAGVRVLVFFVEGFTASFAAMLGVFLAALALGSLTVGAVAARAQPGARLPGVLLAAAGVAVLAVPLALPAFESALAGVREAAFASASPVAAHRRTALVGSALLFAAPAFLLGAVYPLCVRWAAQGRDDALGRAAGAVAAWNAVGAVLGPVAVLTLGALGGRDDRPGGPLLAWATMGWVAVVAGVGLVLARAVAARAGRLSPVVAVVGAAAGVAIGVGAPVVLARSTPEALVRASRVLRGPDGEIVGSRVLRAVRADDTTTASVVEVPPSDRVLYTDEFAAAATGRAYAYMRMLGHLPALSAAEPEHCMVIAFGTGTTAGSLAAHAEVKRLEVVETSRAVLDLAPWFEARNRGVLADPRVQAVVDDGRRALLLHEPDLDVVTLEPLMPYTPAALPLYTRDFYELVRSRLRDGGVCCQWVPVHAMPLDLYASLVRTFFETFPEGSMWFVEQSTVLLGHVGTRRPDAERVRARTSDAQRLLQTSGFARPQALPVAYVASAARVLAVLDDPSRSGEEAVRASPPGPTSRRVVTDEHPFPEASPLPRAGLLTSYLSDTLAWLAGLVAPEDEGASAPALSIFPPELVVKTRAAAADALRGRAMEAIGDYRAVLEATGHGDPAAVVAAYEAAGDLYESVAAGEGLGDAALARRRVRVQRVLLSRAARARFSEADRAAAAGDATGASAAREQALDFARQSFELDTLDPVVTERPAAAATYGEALLRTGRCSEAEAVLSTAAREWPWERTLSDLLAFATAVRRGTAERADLRRPSFAAALPPCKDADVASVRPLLAAWRTAYEREQRDRLREASELLLAAAARDEATAAGIARELAAMPEPFGPVGDAERAALVRRFDRTAPRLAQLLTDPDRGRWAVAFEAAVRRGFETLAVEDVVRDAFLRSPDVARRLMFARWSGVERSRVSREGAVDLLGDADAGVRAAAWDAVARRLGADAAAVGYDAASPDAAAREQAAARARELLRGR